MTATKNELMYNFAVMRCKESQFLELDPNDILVHRKRDFQIVVVSQQLLLLYMLLGIIGFSINAIATMGKDYISKWGKYKLATPVKRADIVKSYFISQLIWLLAGMAFAGIVIGIITAINFVFGSHMTAWQIILGAMIVFVCSLLTFVLSYSLTVTVFKRKEY